MTINLADNSPRISYAVAQGATQTSFAVPFEFFANADLNVYVDETLKTLTTHYTVSGGDGSTGTVTISVTGATGGSTVVITRDVALERTSDFPSSGPFQIGALNTELDRLTAIAADLDDKAGRALQLTDFDVAASLVLPTVDNRKGKTLAFNASTGAVEAGPSISDVQTVSAAAADIATLADIEDGTDATDAIQTVAGISSNVTTVAGVSTNVTTVAGISANVTTVAGISANVTAVAGDQANIGTVSSNISDVNTVASNITDIQNASTNAATATTKASEAATSATNAATSETNAGNSATAAASSASAAATSETNAANSAAAAATALDSFDDRYLGSKTSDPTVDNDGNALVSGALYFNSTANEMRVYDGANWIAASSAGTASLILYEYTATSGQTTFSGADDNSATLSYAVGNLQVVMNGIVLDPSDFTATSGTSVVLASGAATGDLVNIYAFKSFTVADTVSASAGGTFSNAVTIDADGSTVLTVDRATSDGTIIDLQKSGSSVGVIGTEGNDITIDGGVSNHSGLRFSSPAILPRYNGVLADNQVDLGQTGSNYRFKDLYLSGGVYLGGTGSANLLSSYEEGTFSPEITGWSGSYGRQDGVYTKIGNWVYCYGGVRTNGGTGSFTNAFPGVDNLPFTGGASISASMGHAHIVSGSTGIPSTKTSLLPLDGPGSGSDSAFPNWVGVSGDSGNFSNVYLSASSNVEYRFNIAYRTT
jgi:hypothetical protein